MKHCERWQFITKEQSSSEFSRGRSLLDTAITHMLCEVTMRGDIGPVKTHWVGTLDI